MQGKKMRGFEIGPKDEGQQVPAGFQPKAQNGTCGRGLLAADGFNIRTTKLTFGAKTHVGRMQALSMAPFWDNIDDGFCHSGNSRAG